MDEGTHTPTREPLVSFPRSAITRNHPGYVKLLKAVHADRQFVNIFEGRNYLPGSTVALCDLWPEDYPAVPVVLEFAGSDGSGRGHNRSQYLHVLWRWDAGRWREIARTLSVGAEWLVVMTAAALHELGPPAPDPSRAAEVSRLQLVALDAALGPLSAADRGLTLHFLSEQLAARLVKVAS